MALVLFPNPLIPLHSTYCKFHSKKCLRSVQEPKKIKKLLILSYNTINQQIHTKETYPANFASKNLKKVKEGVKITVFYNVINYHPPTQRKLPQVSPLKIYKKGVSIIS